MFRILILCLALMLLAPSTALAQPKDPEAATVSWITHALDTALAGIRSQNAPPSAKHLPYELPLLLPTSAGVQVHDPDGIVINARSLARGEALGIDASRQKMMAIADAGRLMDFGGKVFVSLGGSAMIPADVSARIWDAVSRHAEAQANNSDSVGGTIRAWLWHGVADMADGAAAASRFAASTGRTITRVVGEVTSGAGRAAEIVAAYLR